jgi:hypothetical protein
MPIRRKRVVIGVLTLSVVLGLVVFVVVRPASAPVPGTLAVHYVTTNAAGLPMALVELTLYQPAWARFSSVDMKSIHGWQRMRDVPTNVLTQVKGLCTVSYGNNPQRAARKAGWVDFPTHNNWKLRLELSQSRSGIGGLVDRALHARSYYRVGGWSNIVHGTRAVPYVGRSWRIESEEIRLPFAE